MSCYSPLAGKLKKDGTYEVTSLKAYTSEDYRTFIQHDLVHEYILIPCGKCIGCRLDYCRKWADRMMMELKAQKKGIFLTLTYDDDHVPILFDENDFPVCPTVDKKDVQDFVKRLRRAYDGKNGHPGPIQIRYYAGLEYGDEKQRPHAHMILYGLSIDDFFDAEFVGVNELNQEFFSSNILRFIWSNGNIYMSDVTYATCAYVARYVMKKAQSDLTPWNKGEEKESNLMSRKPGIGVPYLDECPDALKYESVPLPDGKTASIPKIFIQRLPEEEREVIMEQRKKLANDAFLYRLQQNKLGVVEQLEASELNKEKQIRSLKRVCF